MLYLIDPGLDAETSRRLSGYQAEVDAARTRNGPRELDSAVSGIFLGFQAAKSR